MDSAQNGGDHPNPMNAAHLQLNLLVFAAILAGSLAIALFASIYALVFNDTEEAMLAVTIAIVNYAIGYAVGAFALISRNTRQAFALHNDKAARSSVHHPLAIAINICACYLATALLRTSWTPSSFLVSEVVGLIGYAASIFGIGLFQRRQSARNAALKN